MTGTIVQGELCELDRDKAFLRLDYYPMNATSPEDRRELGLRLLREPNQPLEHQEFALKVIWDAAYEASLVEAIKSGVEGQHPNLESYIRMRLWHLNPRHDLVAHMARTYPPLCGLGLDKGIYDAVNRPISRTRKECSACGFSWRSPDEDVDHFEWHREWEGE